jgi:hypothetical protein
MLDIKALQRLGSEATFGATAFIGLVLQSLSGCAHKAAAIDRLTAAGVRFGAVLACPASTHVRQI